jgi:hypothetical protein
VLHSFEDNIFTFIKLEIEFVVIELLYIGQYAEDKICMQDSGGEPLEKQ